MERKKTSGKITFQDKSIYIGELENEIPNGYGVWTHPNGEEYKGQWADGKENGSGIYSYPDGGEFSGNFVDGVKRGFRYMVTSRWILISWKLVKREISWKGNIYLD